MQVKALMERADRLLPDSPSARLDVELLLAHALKRDRSWLYAHQRDMLDFEQNEAFRALLDRRRMGEPIAYLTGSREFWSLTIGVNPDVLIPRPETELLVELTLRRLEGRNPCRVADLGTGSGAIALALARELPGARIVATEASAAALDVARRNARSLGVSHEQLDFRAGDWLEPLGEERFDCLVCNPPYIRDDDPHLEQGDVRFEPRRALAAGPDGLSEIRCIIEAAPHYLARGGALVMEHGHDQQDAVVDELARQHPRANAERHADLAGVPRAVVIQFPA